MHQLRTVLVTVFTLTSIVLAGGASADNCKSPKIVIRNDKPVTIYVSKIQYYDGCDGKWRTENVGNSGASNTHVEIPAGSSVTVTDNLEYVQNCKLPKFKLYRGVKCVNNTTLCFDWGGELVPVEGLEVRCVSGAVYTIRAHD